MKTKLLFLFLLVSTFANAQTPTISNVNHQSVTSTSALVNFNLQNNCLTYSYRVEYSTDLSFSSFSPQTANNYCNASPILHSVGIGSLLPNTLYYYRIRIQISSNLYYSAASTFTTLGETPVFGPSTATPSVTTAIINYSLVAGVGTSTMTVYWGLSQGAMTNSLANGTIFNAGSGSATIEGLTPETLYYFTVEAINSNGDAYASLGTFTTLPAPPAGTEPGLIRDFKFDNDTYDTTNSIQFVSTNSNSPINFGTDRFGVDSKCLITTASAFRESAIPSLPLGNSDRTVSIWYKVDAISTATYPGPFAYGGANTYNTFGLYLNSINVVFQGYAYDQPFTNTTVAGTWYHAVVVFQSGVARIYINGVLKGEISRPLLNTTNSNFRIGNFNGSVDDLKIYDLALTNTEITNLYNFNSTVLPDAPPVVNDLSESVTVSTVAITYTLTSSNNEATSIVKYGLAETSLTSQVNGFSTNNTATNTVSINGLLPDTEYFYQVEATNADGTTLSSIESFTTLQGQAIAEYSFDNTYDNLNGNAPFTSNPNTSFVNDRNGNATSALNLNNAGVEASIPTLPFGGSSRTISVWAKLNTVQNPHNHIFSYGGIFTGLGFAGAFNESAVDFFGYSDDFNVLSANTVATWYHFVYSYDGVNVKLYKNGVLLATEPKNLNTAVYDMFSLGRSLDYASVFDGAIDDLKIYNYALSQEEITALYTTNSLSISDFNQSLSEIKLYPNPASDILNIQTNSTLKSVEIYNIQGQKVVSSNQKQINVAHLASGVYLVKIQDENAKIATKKIVIK
ncbi:chitodextrinase [Flavobacterium arsenatis]|uniref:Chitodextrinase n=1 Tax=Flavobacterium arsenatis TaxID=1484332 RepID=A0ABU1TK18_9FLAO|nr:LamG-like jellyroll fold domain-containing protein [Flavobacterium arsenatis]MDR6966331.1 chitodextrinase [Flavobacterium arsenatis]